MRYHRLNHDLIYGSAYNLEIKEESNSYKVCLKLEKLRDNSVSIDDTEKLLIHESR